MSLYCGYIYVCPSTDQLSYHTAVQISVQIKVTCARIFHAQSSLNIIIITIRYNVCYKQDKSNV